MRKVKARDTTPELVVRRVAHGLGYRFRLVRRDLPGTPDLVFPGRRKAIFVHGCFWHRHEGCARATTPKTRRTFWRTKFERNVERDEEVTLKLGALGWDVLVIWECETKDRTALSQTLAEFLEAKAEPRPQV